MDVPTNDLQEIVKFEPTPRSIEIEVPNDTAIFFYKAGIRIGLEEMERTKRLLVLAGDEGSASRVDNAINALTAFLDTIREVETDIIKEFQEFQQQTGQSRSVDVAFAPHIEPEDEAGDDLRRSR